MPLVPQRVERHQHRLLQQPGARQDLDENYHEPNAEKRLAAAKEAQKIVIDDAVWGMLWYDNWTRVMRVDLVGIEKRWDTFERTSTCARRLA